MILYLKSFRSCVGVLEARSLSYGMAGTFLCVVINRLCARSEVRTSPVCKVVRASFLDRMCKSFLADLNEFIVKSFLLVDPRTDLAHRVVVSRRPPS